MSATTTFGERLKQLRNRAGLSQLGLAQRLGVVRESVVRWENGHRSPTWDVVCRLAHTLGCRVADFDCDTDSK